MKKSPKLSWLPKGERYRRRRTFLGRRKTSDPEDKNQQEHPVDAPPERQENHSAETFEDGENFSLVQCGVTINFTKIKAASK